MSFTYPPHLTILAWVFSDFFLDWPLNAPMLFQNVNNCPANISDLLWQLTIKAVNDASWKKKPLQQEPRGRFSVQLLRTENRHVPDCLMTSQIAAPKIYPVLKPRDGWMTIIVLFPNSHHCLLFQTLVWNWPHALRLLWLLRHSMMWTKAQSMQSFL